MKRILILLTIASSLLFAEEITISGIVQSATTYDNKTILVIRNYDKEFVRAETRINNIEVDDKVSGRCSTYEASTWKSCSIYAEKTYSTKKSEMFDINGKIKYVTILSDYNVLEIENNNDILQTVNIRVNKNINYEKNEKVYGYCQKEISGEYTNCTLTKKMY